MGLVKTVFDLLNVCLTLAMGFAFAQPFCGIGLGTLLAMVGSGPGDSPFNRFCRLPLVPPGQAGSSRCLKIAVKEGAGPRPCSFIFPKSGRGKGAKPAKAAKISCKACCQDTCVV